MNRRVWILVAALAAGAVGSSCAKDNASSGSSTAATTTKGFNSACCCGKPVDGKTFVAYKGKTIGVCGPACLTEWNKMSDKDKDVALAKVMPK